MKAKSNFILGIKDQFQGSCRRNPSVFPRDRRSLQRIASRSISTFGPVSRSLAPSPSRAVIDLSRSRNYFSKVQSSRPREASVFRQLPLIRHRRRRISRIVDDALSSSRILASRLLCPFTVHPGIDPRSKVFGKDARFSLEAPAKRGKIMIARV